MSKKLFPDDNNANVLFNSDFIPLSEYIEQDEHVNLTVSKDNINLKQGQSDSFTYNTDGVVTVLNSGYFDYNIDYKNNKVNLKAKTDVYGESNFFLISSKEDYADAYALIRANIQEVYINSSPDILMLNGSNSSGEITVSSNADSLEYIFDGNNQCLMTLLENNNLSKTFKFYPNNDASITNANGIYNLIINAKINNEIIKTKNIIISINDWIYYTLDLSEYSGSTTIGQKHMFTVITNVNDYLVSSSNENIATVSKDGDVVAILGMNKGNAIITVVAENKTKTYNITVN